MSPLPRFKEPWAGSDPSSMGNGSSITASRNSAVDDPSAEEEQDAGINDAGQDLASHHRQPPGDARREGPQVQPVGHCHAEAIANRLSRQTMAMISRGSGGRWAEDEPSVEEERQADSRGITSEVGGHRRETQPDTGPDQRERQEGVGNTADGVADQFTHPPGYPRGPTAPNRLGQQVSRHSLMRTALTLFIPCHNLSQVFGFAHTALKRCLRELDQQCLIDAEQARMLLVDDGRPAAPRRVARRPHQPIPRGLA